MNKKIITSLFITAIISLAATGIKNVSAQSEQRSNQGASLIQKIAAKFNLNQSDVQAVFDEHRNEMKAQQMQNYELRLSQLVADGQITEAQKKLLLDKKEQFQNQREVDRSTNQNLTPQERKEQMDSERNALENWANENGIDAKYLFLHGGRPFDKDSGGFRHGKGMGMMRFSLSPSPATAQ